MVDRGIVAFIGLRDFMVVGNWQNFNYKEQKIALGN
jgi:hypothetical protein